MDFDSWMAAAWNEHGHGAAAVAQRLPQAASLVKLPSQLARLAHLTLHLHADHLAQWDEGRTALQALQQQPQHQGEAVAALTLDLAVLNLAAGHPQALDGLPGTEGVRATAMAAAALADHDAARAQALLQQATAAAEAAALNDGDPTLRALAVAGNNLAVALTEKTTRSTAETELMILAAQMGRRYWERAGTWLQVERAEYRLACVWRHAGQPTLARHHARLCLDIVALNEGAALERFFGWEALGQAEAAAGNRDAHAQALVQAREAFAALGDADRPWCQAELDALSAAMA